MPYVIKRYSNRKLYDTQESRYVTLDEIEEMVRAGKEISVVDAASGEDLTSVTLTQIILENERARRGSLPTSFLHQLIKHGEAWQDFIQRSLRASLEGTISSQRELDRVFRDWAARAGWSAFVGGEPPRQDGAESQGEKAGEAEKARDADKAREADRLRDEVTSLRERLRLLEERLEKRKGEGN